MFSSYLPAPKNITRSELIKIRKENNWTKTLRIGWCKRMNDGRELCRDNKGYYIIGSKN